MFLEPRRNAFRVTADVVHHGPVRVIWFPRTGNGQKHELGVSSLKQRLNMPFQYCSQPEEKRRDPIDPSTDITPTRSRGLCLKPSKEDEEAKVPGGPKRRNVNQPKSCDLYAARD